MSFRSHRQAGHQLGQLLRKFELERPVVVAATPGGQLVAEEVGRSLDAQVVSSRINGTLLAGLVEQPLRQLRARVVVLVDDCVASGATIASLLRSLRELQPTQLILAVPVLPHEQLELLQSQADDVVCLFAPAGPVPSCGYYDDAAPR
jgi:predicted phosphoribosyltransferase